MTFVSVVVVLVVDVDDVVLVVDVDDLLEAGNLFEVKRKTKLVSGKKKFLIKASAFPKKNPSEVTEGNFLPDFFFKKKR